MSALPLSEPDRSTSLQRHKHPLLFDGDDDKVDRNGFPVLQAATKQGKGSRTGYIPWAICFCTIPRPKTDELAAAHGFT